MASILYYLWGAKFLEMSALNFDTLRYANRLVQVGVAREQAEVQAQTLAELIGNDLADKRDVQELKNNIDRLRLENSRDIEELKLILSNKLEVLQLEIQARDSKMVGRFGAMLAAAIAILATSIKLL